MTLAEMVDAIIQDGGNGNDVVNELIKYGHLPPDANTRPAGQTAQQVRTVEELRTKVKLWVGE